MPQLLGEYDCKIDAKGRLRLPTLLMKQLGELLPEFVINRGFENYLILYPKATWDKITKEINQLNQYDPKKRAFVRYFYRGATPIAVDSSERILLPKRLIEYAGIKKETVLFAVNDRIEVWDKAAYDIMITQEPEDFSELAAEVMAKTEASEENRKAPGTGWNSDQ